MLAPVYPRQVLQIGLCTPCDDKIFSLYAKTHDSLKTNFLCRISNQAEMLNFISHHANLINYTIASEMCKLMYSHEQLLHRNMKYFM